MKYPSLVLTRPDTFSKTTAVGFKSLAILINSLNKIEKKIIKSKKNNYADSLKSISLIKNKLFPENKLQERHENFIPYYLKYGDNFIKKLKDELNPLDTNFVVLAL